jgi:hypothetical protein
MEKWEPFRDANELFPPIILSVAFDMLQFLSFDALGALFNLLAIESNASTLALALAPAGRDALAVLPARCILHDASIEDA